MRNGGLCAFATETVYGLGAVAFNELAVARVFEAKGRPTFDPLIVHIAEFEGVNSLVIEVPAIARRLMQAFWPGPLTLVLLKRPEVPDLVTAGLPTVAVRLPDHPQARELIRLTGSPVAAPSANLFGRISPTTAEHVREQLGGRIDLILDGGPCRVGVESTVVQIEGDAATLLRPGGVTIEELRQHVPTLIVPERNHRPAAVLAPGMLPQHYAPRAPVTMVENWDRVAPEPSSAALAFRTVPRPERFVSVEYLSPTGDLREAASRLFAALRRLDDLRPAMIYAERLPDVGLGVTINDRLTRAACRDNSPPAG